MKHRLQTIRNYWLAIKNGDVEALKRTLSPHLIYSDKANFEIMDTRIPRVVLGMNNDDDNRYSVRLVNRGVHLSYQVFLDNRILYEEPVWFDENQLIVKVGFAKQCEFVEKVCYIDSDPFFAFGIREKKENPIKYIIGTNNKEMFLVTRDELMNIDDFAEDEFKPIKCKGIHAGTCPIIVDVNISYMNGSKEKFQVWVGGSKHEYFTDFSKSFIDGRTLIIPPNRQRIWSVIGVDLNRRKEIILLPEGELITFKTIVPKEVFITDALDNDWKIVENSYPKEFDNVSS